MTGKIIKLPARPTSKDIPTPAVDWLPAKEPTNKPLYDGARLGFDFNEWCVELFVGEQLKRRIPRLGFEKAHAELDRLVGEGLRRLPPSELALREEAKL